MTSPAEEDQSSLLISSTNESLMTPSPNSSTTSKTKKKDNLLATLLHQIQHYHSSELKKLNDKLKKWRAYCIKAVKKSNDNATVAEKYRKCNKDLHKQLKHLKHQLLKCQRHNPQNGKSPDSLSPKEAQLHLPRDCATKVTSKLAKKQRKKIRYSEAPSIVIYARDSTEESQTVAEEGKDLLERSARVDSTVRVVPETVETPVGLVFDIDDLQGIEGESLANDITCLPPGDNGSMGIPTDASTPLASQSQSSYYSFEPQSFNRVWRDCEPDAGATAPKKPRMNKWLSSSVIPKSETQFPVDLCNTQQKSPTFCGETTSGNLNGLSRHHKPSTTPGNLNALDRQRRVPLNNRTPDVSDRSDITDESCELEKSMLLLGPPVYTLNVGKLKTVASNEMTSDSQKKSDSRKRKLDVATDGGTVDDAVAVSNIRSGNTDKQLVNNVSSGITASKVKGQSTKPLKQTKLDETMFKNNLSTSALLRRECNGRSLVNISSQFDANINEAIEQSLLANQEPRFPVAKVVKMESTNGKEDAGDSKGEFKRPILFRKQRSLNSPGTRPVQISRSSHQDLSGSVDPMAELTFMECERYQSPPARLRASRPGRTLKTQQSALVANGNKDDSCDLFDDSEENGSGHDEERSSANGNKSGFDSNFGKVNGRGHQEEEQLLADRNKGEFDYNFDKVPQKTDVADYKYTKVVRKHDERNKLKGHGCKQCDNFYGGLALSSSQQEQRKNICSRHRAQYSPPSTPDHYWSIGFPDTQTCRDRGYFKEANVKDLPEKKRTRNKYKTRCDFN